jgi:hypothetical protein
MKKVGEAGGDVARRNELAFGRAGGRWGRAHSSLSLSLCLCRPCLVSHLSSPRARGSSSVRYSRLLPPPTHHHSPFKMLNTVGTSTSTVPSCTPLLRVGVNFPFCTSQVFICLTPYDPAASRHTQLRRE